MVTITHGHDGLITWFWHWFAVVAGSKQLVLHKMESRTSLSVGSTLDALGLDPPPAGQ